MPYDPYRGMTPGGQFAGMLGTSLSQILGGYLGAKLEQDKMQREFDANRRILKARYPNISEEQLSEYAQVPSQQLPQLLQGLGAREFQQVLGGQAPQQEMPEQIPGQIPQEMQPGMAPQEMQPGMAPEEVGQMPDMPQLPSQQVFPQQQPYTTEDALAISDEANRIAALEDNLKNASLDENQYMLIRKYIDDSKKALRDTVLSDQQLQMKLAEADRKRLLDEQKTALEQAKFERKILTEDRAHKLKKLEQEEKQQNKLIEQYGKRYAELIDSKNSKLEDLEALKYMQEANRNPNVDFGYPAFNTFIGFLQDKMGIDASGFRGDAAQIIEKQTAGLLFRLLGDLRGSGIRAAKVITAAAKKNPNLYQSYRARAFVIDNAIAETELHLSKINEAQKLYEKNNYKFVPGFFTRVDKKMKPNYKKYFKTLREIPKKIENDKGLQQKQRIYDRRVTGAKAGVAGGLTYGLYGATAGGAAGGIPGAIMGGLGGLALGFGGAFAGERLAEPAVEMAKGHSPAMGNIYAALGASPEYVASRTGRLADVLTPQQVAELRRTAID